MSKKHYNSIILSHWQSTEESKEYLQTLNLNDRQIKSILYAKENGKITNSEYQKINDCSRNTASNDLSELVEKELLNPSGQKGAGAFYSLN